MPISFSLDKYNDFAFSNKRIGASASSLTVDYDVGDQVAAARDKITDMGPWDRFADSAFHGGNKRKALDAIATLVLCEGAAKWKEKNPDRAGGVVKGLTESDRRAATLQLLELSSPTGRQALLHNPVLRGTDVECSPVDGDDGYAGHLFNVVMPATMAVKFLEKEGKGFCTPKMYEAAATLLGQEAAHLRGENRPDKAALRYKEQARCLIEAALPEAAKQAYENMADAYSLFAKNCVKEGSNAGAASALQSVARAWEQAGDEKKSLEAQAQSAQPFLEYASELEQKGENESAGRAFRKAAKGYEVRNDKRLATEVKDHETLATQVDNKQLATESWENAAKCFGKEFDYLMSRPYRAASRSVIVNLLKDCGEAWHQAGNHGKAAQAYTNVTKVCFDYPAIVEEYTRLAKEEEAKAEAQREAPGAD